MQRLVAIASIPCLALILFPACHGHVATESSASTQGAGGAGDPVGCEPPCCADDPQFPITHGDTCVQCETDADCAQLGISAAYGLKCQPDGMCGCAVDNDCVGDPGYPRCRAADASCVQCLSNADCDTTCDTQYGNCKPCSADADCHVSGLGPHCSPQGCSCASDAECASSPNGPHCLGLGIEDNVAICGCSADAECAGSARGHVCVSSVVPEPQCGCSSDADCAVGSSCQTAAHRCLPM
jgi:hypothetical protein